MNLRTSASLVAVTLLAMGACKSTGTDKASSTVGDLKNLQTELVDGQHAIHAAVTALNALAAEGGDMTAEYKAFSKSVDGVASQRDRVRSIRESLGERRQAFIASWDQGLVQIQNASLKERSKERRDAVVAKFDKLEVAGDETRGDFDEWYGDLVDVRTYLEHDLNPKGVASVSRDVKSIETRAGKINVRLAEFASKLDDLVQALAAAKPPESAGTGG